MELTKDQKRKVVNYIKNMPFNKWEWFNNFYKSEAEFILHLIQNQTGGSLETNGESYKPETNTKFRKLRTDYV